MNASVDSATHSFCDAALDCIHSTFPASVLNPTFTDSFSKNAVSSLTTMLTCAQAAESSVAASDEMGRLQISIFVKTTRSDGSSKWALPFSSIDEIHTSMLPFHQMNVPDNSSDAAGVPCQSQVTSVLGQVGQGSTLGGNHPHLHERIR